MTAKPMTGRNHYFECILADRLFCEYKRRNDEKDIRNRYISRRCTGGVVLMIVGILLLIYRKDKEQ